MKDGAKEVLDAAVASAVGAGAAVGLFDEVRRCPCHSNLHGGRASSSAPSSPSEPVS